MAGHDISINAYPRDDISEIGLDEDDQKIIHDAEQDSTKVVTKTPAKPYQLGYISVFGIIVNKMIGTGIFDTPSTIMHGTKSVGFTLIFWLLGSIATMAGTLVFIEYGLTIPRWDFNGTKIFTPRSGGEFNYLNYLIKKPRFFASCLYGIVFVLIGNAAANALSFATHVMAASGHTDVNNARPSKGSSNSVRVIAVGTMTAVCLLHGIWRRAGIVVNNFFAFVKILILVMIIILGFISIGGKVFGVMPPVSANLDPSTSFKAPQRDAFGYAEAYLSVVFAFGGFNQANYVLGEIRQPKKVYKSATLLAVGTVSVLYMLVNIAYMIVVPADSQVTGNVAEQFVQLTLGQVSNYGSLHATEILNAFMAFSSLGNVIVSTYTAARVKQEIAKEGVLPFSKLIARNYDALSRLTSCFHRRSSRMALANEEESMFHAKTPLGALLVHWFFSLVIIFGTWGVVSPISAYTIAFGAYSYTIDAFMTVVIAMGLLCLRALKNKTRWHEKSSSNAIVSIVAATLCAIANMFPIVALWVPPTPAFKTDYPWFLVPSVGIALLAFGLFYWAVFVGVVPKLGGNRGKELRVERSPFFHSEHGAPVQVAEVVAFDWVLKS